MMKLALATAILTATVTLAHAGDPGGVWQSEKDADGDWIDLAIEPCGDNFCGKIANVYGGNPKVVGITIIKGMTQVSDTAWSDGRIFAVDENKWYDSKMELLSPNHLKISGCVAYGLLCEAQTLTRQE